MHFSSYQTPLINLFKLTVKHRMSWLIAELHSLSPVLVIGDGGQRWVQAVDVERHVTLIAQQLHVSILFPATHAAGAEAALSIGVSLAVLTLWAALPWFQGQDIHTRMHTYLKMVLWYRLGNINLQKQYGHVLPLFLPSVYECVLSAAYV